MLRGVLVLDFTINLTEKSNVPVVSVNGEIDVYTSPKLDETLSAVFKQGKKTVVLNLEEVHYIDSTGLGIIAHSADTFSTNGGKLNVVCSKPQIKKIFDVSGLTPKRISLFDIESDALLR